MGRPTKRTPEVEARIVEGLEKGYPKKAAAAVAGIAYTTMREWELAFPEFAALIEKAEHAAQARLLDVIRDQMPSSWQAAAWLLERRWSQEFGRREHMTVDMTAVVREIAATMGVDEAEAVAEAERILAGAR